MIEIVYPGTELLGGIPDPDPKGCSCCMCDPKSAATLGQQYTASRSAE